MQYFRFFFVSHIYLSMANTFPQQYTVQWNLCSSLLCPLYGGLLYTSVPFPPHGNTAQIGLLLILQDKNTV